MPQYICALSHYFTSLKLPLGNLIHHFWIATLFAPLFGTAYHNFGLIIKVLQYRLLPSGMQLKPLCVDTLFPIVLTRKKALEENRKNLEREVIRLEQIHKPSPKPANLKALVAAKTELNLDHTCHVHKLLLYTKQKYYKFGNKSTCLLAHQLKNQNNDSSINMRLLRLFTQTQ